MTSRRSFLELAAMSAMALALPRFSATRQSRQRPTTGFVDLHRQPDSVIVVTGTGESSLLAAGGRWSADGVTVNAIEVAGALKVQLSAPRAAVKDLRLRWRGRMNDNVRLLGDAWERGYGDLEWRGWVPDRVMPWYAAIHDDRRTHVYGVRTGARAFCYWQIDPQGISLVADVRSGGSGVELRDRTLDVCDVICRPGRDGESAFAAIHAACRDMCASPRLPSQPIFGSNDWYWAYGKNSAETVRLDAQHIVDLSPASSNRPFVVIDDGWQPVRGRDRAGAGTWDRGNEKFPSMPDLAADIRRIGGRPGIWIRPLQAMTDAPDAWRLPRARGVLDPSVPEVRQKIDGDIARLSQWGFDLIKHDYTTFDICGRWGNQMGAAPTNDGWTFATGSARTTAEVIDDLYKTIRDAAGDGFVIGCNTVSHLSAGRFEICRVGDDTSGTDWTRTRKMGVNTLAFRGPQHGVFYVADADCVGVTTAIPWALNRQWLDLLSRSGTMLFVSLAPDALGSDERRDLKTALARAAMPHPLGEPLDWDNDVYPTRWRLLGEDAQFNWMAADSVLRPA